MKVIHARISGFCDGVKRAMRLALAAADTGGVWADGPLVHNDQAVCLLALQGVNVSERARPGDRKALIRAHGATPERRRDLAASGLEVVDATCPHVAHNQRLAALAAERGETVVVAGDADHAEVRAIAGSAGPGCRTVSSVRDIEALEPDGPVLFLAQTTFNVTLFAAMAEAMRRRFPDCRVADTICRATHDRQEEAARVARLADVLVVVGGRESANTRRLADTGRAQGKPVFQVETAAELRAEDFAGFATAAVTSGASTPGWITQEVVNRLLFMGKTTPAGRVLRAVHTLAESRLLTAVAAGGLALAAQFALLGALTPLWAAAGACYVFFAHILNRRVPADRQARNLSHVDSFYQKRRRRLLVLAWLAAAVALVLAAADAFAFALFSVAILAAAVYAFLAGRRPLLPPLARRLVPVVSPRLGAMSLGWAAVLAGPPALEAKEPVAGAAALLFVFLVCLGGTLIRDLHDIVSDRLIGIDTLPARIGLARARVAARGALRLGVLLPLGGLAHQLSLDGGGIWPWFFPSLSLAPGLGLYLLARMEKGRLPDAVFLQAGVDGMGCLAGLLALAAEGLS